MQRVPTREKWNFYTPENERMSPQKEPFYKEISSSNHKFSEDMFSGDN